VSWYEAAAYADSQARNCRPSVTGRPRPRARAVRRLASGPSSRGAISEVEALSRWAVPQNTTAVEVFDLAGNAREWCWNEYESGRAIRGGAWDDHSYMFAMRTQMPAFDRSPRNGFRCMRVTDRAKVPSSAFEPVPRARVVRDYSRETPVGEAVFAAYRQQVLVRPAPAGCADRSASGGQ